MLRGVVYKQSPAATGELDRLIAVFRENPRSTIFVALAQNYLATGQPLEAVHVLTQGLANYPDHVEARLALGRAHRDMQRWRDAEVELVKVIKLDRYSQPAFALLGEVLIRRGNFDVATQALQRARDLDPTDDETRMMLERARTRQPLDAPTPRPSLAQGSSAPESVEEFSDDGPTIVTLEPFHESETGIPSADLVEAITAPVAAPAPSARPKFIPQLFEPAPAPRRHPLARATPAQHPAEPDPELRVEPRSGGSPEEYLNQFLGAHTIRRPAEESEGGGAVNDSVHRPMTDTPIEGDSSSTARRMGLDHRIDDRIADPIHSGERWGRSIERPFLWLWLLLGGVTALFSGWYLLDLRARNAAVAAHLGRAHSALAEMSAASLAVADNEASQALARDPASIAAVTSLAGARAFALLVYGAGQVEDVATAIAAAKQRSKESASTDGERELLLARTAFALSSVHRGLDMTNELTGLRPELDQALRQWPDEPLLFWLSGLVQLTTGDRGGARNALGHAADLGFVMADIAIADMAADEGRAAAAAAGYDAALAKTGNSQLALVGSAVVRAESDGDVATALRELEPSLLHVDGKRTEAWSRLALSMLANRNGDVARARIELDAAVATGLAEPRFLARVALANLENGRIDAAVQARARVRARSADPFLPTLDAELLLANGRPDEALKALGTGVEPRLRRLRGRALLDLDRAGDAAAEFARAGAGSEVKAFLELARVTANPAIGMAALAPLGDAKALPIVRGLVGEGYLIVGDTAQAGRLLAGALEGNPLAFRAATRLAELDLTIGKVAEAESAARTALAAAPGYLPAHSALGRAMVAAGKQSDAGPELQLIVDAGRAGAADELAYAEAALAMGQPETARVALARAAEKGVGAAQLARVTALLDPPSAPTATPTPTRARPRRSGR